MLVAKIPIVPPAHVAQSRKRSTNGENMLDVQSESNRYFVITADFLSAKSRRLTPDLFPPSPTRRVYQIRNRSHRSVVHLSQI
jgi:hypothetical protein